MAHPRNQFNISSSVIGQLSIGNKGQTIYNKESKHFEKGATDLDLKISGGHFPQANIAGEATYNNKDSTIGGGGKGGGNYGMTVKELMFSSGKAEERVLRILRSGIDAANLKKILQNGLTLEKIEKALSNCPRSRLDQMIQSMLRSDAKELDSDSD